MDKLTVILYLSICNVTWFYNYSLGYLKFTLLIFMLFFNRKIFLRKKNYYLAPLFSLLVFGILLNFYLVPPTNNFNKSYFVFGFIECYILFTIGVYYTKNNYLDYNFFKKILWLIIPLCIIIFINFQTGYPSWHSPDAYQSISDLEDRGIYTAVIEPLFSTGFSIARTSWSNSLCQFIPIALLLKESWYKRIVILLLSFCVIISSSRGGMLCLATIFSLYYFFIIKSAAKKLFIIAFMLILYLLLYQYWDQIAIFLRLSGSDDLSTGRLNQYALLPKILQDYSIWGFGANSMASFYHELGGNYTLHNSYLRLSLELGIPFMIPFLILLYVIIKILIATLFRKSNQDDIRKRKILSLITISGLITCMFEPQGVFGTINWYSIWWFIFGVNYYKYIYIYIYGIFEKIKQLIKTGSYLEVVIINNKILSI